MPPKKKKGKGSKLARMSEEERIRYLQHRAELELEAKRRKQQLIAVFTKNKLKREEAFARLNTAKINEQWRFQLRQIKCKELYENLEYLWKSFDQTLKAKDVIIQQLYNELNKADIDHRRLQEVHIEMIDKFIGRHRLRLTTLHDKYMEAIMKIKVDELNEMNRAKGQLTDNYRHLETIVYAQNNFIEDKLMETRTRNSINTTTIEYSRNEATTDVKQRIGGKIDGLWSQLNDVIADYQETTASKKKQYEHLKEADEAHILEAAAFPGQQAQLLRTIETLKCQEDALTQTSNRKIAELRRQIDLLNCQIWKLRQDIRMNQTMDEIQLKRLSLTSGGVVSLERNLLSIKQYAINPDTTLENATYSVMSPFNKLEKFWEQFNYVKTENIFRKKEHNELMLENNKLKQSLRIYLTTVARIPTAANRPQTLGERRASLKN